jgi:hypothetical protein
MVCVAHEMALPPAARVAWGFFFWHVEVCRHTLNLGTILLLCLSPG